MNTKSTTAVGIDGCRAGWIAAIRRPEGSLEWRLVPRISDLLHELPATSTILIDMIIGLPDENHPTRECDRLARRLLSPYGSRVFPAPPRQALAAESYAEACALARQATGKAISKQCWHLFPKIRELDAMANPRFRESHPELVFTRLNDNLPIAATKKTRQGQTQRLKLLEPALPDSCAKYEDALKRFPRQAVTQDDLIDALGLCLAAMSFQDLKRVPEEGPLPTIWY